METVASQPHGEYVLGEIDANVENAHGLPLSDPLTPSAALSSPDFRFDPLTQQHLPMLREWLLRPHVAQWWGDAESIAELHSDYILAAGEPNATRAYIAKLGAEPIGFIQSYVVMGSGGGWWEDETDPGARGIDQFLCEARQLNQGIGRRMIRAFVSRLFGDAGVSVIQTDPDPTNLRAVRCYAAAGFRAVTPVITPDGPALLMRCTRQSLALAAENAASPFAPADLRQQGPDALGHPAKSVKTALKRGALR